MRVSIVATSLDGQQPEPKSVINMVHRIQNRNPGYTDFSNTGSSQSFTFSNPTNSIITNGANALKIEEEIKSENLDVSSNEMDAYQDNSSEKETFQSQEVENSSNTVESNFSSNGLENFKFNEEETPELFNSDTEVMNEESSIKSGEDQISEEDDLEIPAFLRRQKN